MVSANVNSFDFLYFATVTGPAHGAAMQPSSTSASVNLKSWNCSSVPPAYLTVKCHKEHPPQCSFQNDCPEHEWAIEIQPEEA